MKGREGTDADRVVPDHKVRDNPRKEKGRREKKNLGSKTTSSAKTNKNEDVKVARKKRWFPSRSGKPPADREKRVKSHSHGRAFADAISKIMCEGEYR